MNNDYSVYVWKKDSLLFWIPLVLLSIDDTVDNFYRTGPEERQAVDQQYNRLTAAYSSLKDSIKKKAGGVTGGMGSAIRNVKNIARNAFDNTVGYGIAKYQNAKTTRHLSHDPRTTGQVVYLMHGLFQNEGSQWRFAKQLRKQGKIPYHVKGHHGLKREENAEKTYQQIGGLHQKTNLYKPHERNDAFSGHSSGGDMGIYLAGDHRTKQYGIKQIQARAPAPTGIKAKTFGQRLLMPLAKEDNVKHYEGRRSVVELSERKPVVPVQVLAGEADRLVLPEQTAYQHAADHHILRGPDSTHFGTSGGHKEMNQQFISHLDKPSTEYKPLQPGRPSNVVSMSGYKSRTKEQELPEYHSPRKVA